VLLHARTFEAKQATPEERQEISGRSARWGAPFAAPPADDVGYVPATLSRS